MTIQMTHYTRAGSLNKLLAQWQQDEGIAIQLVQQLQTPGMQALVNALEAGGAPQLIVLDLRDNPISSAGLASLVGPLLIALSKSSASSLTQFRGSRGKAGTFFSAQFNHDRSLQQQALRLLLCVVLGQALQEILLPACRHSRLQHKLTTPTRVCYCLLCF